MRRYDIRTYGEVDGEDRSGLPEQIARQRERVERRLADVGRLVPVVSGKGGVGKSFVAAGVAAALADSGWEVGLLDADLAGPTAARMTGLDGEGFEVTRQGVVPPQAAWGGPVASTALLLEEDAPLEWRGPEGDSFVWRGAQEHAVLRELLSDVVWGRLDALVVDLPPGPGRFQQLLDLVERSRLRVVVVTIPSGASRSSVERSLRVALAREAPVAGVAENMSGYACPECGREGPLFPGDAGRELASSRDVPLLGRIPFDPRAAALADEGRLAELISDTSAGAALRRLAAALRGSDREER